MGGFRQQRDRVGDVTSHCLNHGEASEDGESNYQPTLARAMSVAMSAVGMTAMVAVPLMPVSAVIVVAPVLVLMVIVTLGLVPMVIVVMGVLGIHGSKCVPFGGAWKAGRGQSVE